MPRMFTSKSIHKLLITHLSIYFRRYQEGSDIMTHFTHIDNLASQLKDLGSPQSDDETWLKSSVHYLPIIQISNPIGTEWSLRTDLSHY